jgi:RNA polymerase sigma factor (sigma-70 family)
VYHGWRLRRDVSDLAEQAAHEALNQAYDLRRYPEYFQDAPEFQRWLAVVASRRALRLLLQHAPVGRALNLLPAGQRRILGLVYLDKLNYSDIAHILGIPAEEASRRRQEALDTLRQLL